ncbi:MAG: Photosystem I reaction center subunit III [Cyanobacteria bacterium QH_8_48_120]|jgi:photosystem I subunit 3|nr:MAG: Photosystem I reaction center subunit III [Cyanobacteria bacterium QH_2_48_84]PSO64367.1 MAG: Photosystem I reaction center subunit III [Cyanobacteria bacterium QH_7_48_89]PSO67382.1 MAG: Photosystem I reaction center subunit III [Cyanobacteria bacterium QS_1_48_34]PSO72122.1 MAG: Photosystem I reaction center subunit III [Cyanobacteria bacterium QH_8_48_120]PSO76869.1 MAG: Photosystem I reaction center subunit III [Cyanobacteria bacterium QH_3_48_40]PSO78595.1 MAG: Photosystem I react
MRRLLALIVVVTLWLGFAPDASAQEEGVSRLVPCRESPAFQERAKNAEDTVISGEKRFERYGDKLCGPEGLPHLVVDGRLSHAGEIITPSLLFLYIAGWIGWAGRSYLNAIKKEKKTAEKEILIDVPLAFKCTVSALLWPVAAVKEFLSGQLAARETDIPILPR